MDMRQRTGLSLAGLPLAGLAMAALAASAAGGAAVGTPAGGAADRVSAARLASHVQTAAASGPGCRWVMVPAPSPPADSLLGGVATRSPTDAWAVGRSRSADDVISALIEHWNGTAWRVISSPDVGQSSTLSAVAIVSAGNAWAVGSYRGDTLGGDKALVEQWNGRSWTRVPSPHPGGVSWLTAVAVISPRNAWAVGGYEDQVGSNDKAFTVHWNGRKWLRVPIPVTSTGVLSGVAATGWSDVWAVGYAENAVTQVVILHWNGRGWKRAPYRGPAGSSYLAGVAAVSQRDVWAVGNTIRGTDVGPAFTVRWNGSKWLRVPIPDAGTSVLSGVAATSPRNVWAAGGGANDTVIEHWDGANWTRVPSSGPGVSSGLDAVAASSASNVWAVGSYHQVPHDFTLALHCS